MKPTLVDIKKQLILLINQTVMLTSCIEVLGGSGRAMKPFMVLPCTGTLCINRYCAWNMAREREREKMSVCRSIVGCPSSFGAGVSLLV